MKNKFHIVATRLRIKLLDIRSIVRYIENLNLDDYPDEKIQEFITAMEELDRDYFSSLFHRNENTVYSLRSKARTLGIKGYDKLTKEELILRIDKKRNREKE